MTAQIRDGSTLTYKMVDDDVRARDGIAMEYRLPCEAGKSACTGMVHDIRVNDVQLQLPTQPGSKRIGQRGRDCVDTNLAAAAKSPPLAA